MASPARDLGLDEIGDELDLLRNKSGPTRLGFAALLKFLLWRGRFPRDTQDLPTSPGAGVDPLDRHQ